MSHLERNVMASPTSGETRSDISDIDFWSSHPINWPALYAVLTLMLGVAVLSAWVGNYESAATTGLFFAGGTLLVYGRVRERLGNEARQWRWAGIGVWGAVGVWHLIQLAAAWLQHGG